MHAGTEQLLTIRDGDPVEAKTRQHVENCAECRGELARLRSVRESLRGLPELIAPADGWSRVEARLNQPEPRSRWWPGAAVAATVLVAMAVWLFSGSVEKHMPVGQYAQNEATQATSPATSLAAKEPEIDELVSQSRRLEALLRDLDEQSPRVMKATTAGTIAGLQDGIALIDYGLSRNDDFSSDQSEQLWRQRVDLMNTLVQVRGAQLQQISN